MGKRNYIYILTYVTISEQEYANGYCTAECFDSYVAAIEKLMDWKEQEKSLSEHECKIVTDKPDEFHATWNDGKEQIIMRVLVRTMNAKV